MNARIVAFLLAGGLAASLYAQFVSKGAERSVEQQAEPQQETSSTNASRHTMSCEVPELAELALDPDQEERVLAMCQQCDRRTSDLSDVIETKEEELTEALSAGELDCGRVRELARELGDARSEMLMECVEAVISVRETLRPEQRACLERCCETGCKEAPPAGSSSEENPVDGE